MKHNLFYRSKDKKTTIHAIEWTTEKPKAVLQIVHGMCEYIDRYDEFAEFLSSQGIYVVGNDHLGHGESVVSNDDYGYFADTAGNAYLLGDIHSLRKITKEKYPDIPYFILGHSMGSFLIRQYIQLDGEGLSGAIIMGTGDQATKLLEIGKSLCEQLARTYGWRHRSSLVNAIAFGSYNKKIKNPKSLKDWITHDEVLLDKYINDPWCTFTFTLNGFYNMFYSIGEAQDPRMVSHTPKDLPILVVSGNEDPVGNYGKGVLEAYKLFENAGIEDISLKLYEEMRHEVLNEVGCREVYNDLLQWILSRHI